MLLLTVPMLRASWDYHAQSQPMLQFNLPDGEDVDLRVAARKNFDYAKTVRLGDGNLYIEFNPRMHGTSDTLHRTMAHEMIHWYMWHHNIKDNNDHGRVFERYAKAVCKFHGYDHCAFIC